MSESRIETFLKAAMTEEKETNLPKPRSRVEELLQNMADNGVAGGGSNSGGVSVQPDLSQNDPNAPDYVKNRTHYEETVFGDTLVWDGNTDGHAKVVEADYYKVSGAIPTLEDVAKGGRVTRVQPDGTVKEYTIKTETLLNMADGVFCYAQTVFSISEEWAGVTVTSANLTFPEAGTYVLGEMPYTITINGYNGFETTAVKPLDEKYIPDTIQRVGSDVIVPSSTEGSTKRFKITVDDAGTITATEVMEE